MLLEGVVTNVAAFGAFIDIGVHQDGLVHVSAMAKRFVTDPRDVVKPGDIVRVRVVNVDLARKRISLTPAARRRRRPHRTAQAVRRGTSRTRPQGGRRRRHSLTGGTPASHRR
jgi:uncharacterized protein